MRPAITRNNELLPAPFGPVKTSALPAETEKVTPENTRRPPRMQVKSRPDSFIATIFLSPVSADEAAVQGRTSFFPRSLVQNYRSCGRIAKSPYKLAFRRVMDVDPRTPAFERSVNVSSAGEPASLHAGNGTPHDLPRQ